MSYPLSLDSTGLFNWATRSVAELSQRRAEINALNVFPVADADTGSNMAHTMEAAVAQARRGGDVAEALAIGSVRGARGNSGMVLSQVLRGVADATQDSEIDAVVLEEALNHAVSLVDRAIADPVEGTIITVLKAAASEATDALKAGGESAQLHGMLVRVLDKARTALAQTPSQLEVLREAGVVDAGGTGLVILLECLLAQLEGHAQTPAQPLEEPAAELEVVFFFEGDVDEVARLIGPMGNSLVVARETAQAASVHIHSVRAGEVIETAFATGKVSNLRLEVLPSPGVVHSAAGKEPTHRRRIFAVAPQGPVADIFSGVGVETVEPSHSAAATQPGDIFLPNGSAVDPGEARVVPTDSYVAGIAAISVFDPAEADTDAVVSAMRDAARSMRVIRPQAHTTDAIVVAARELLAAGGEQVSVLSPRHIDAEELSRRLGVETMVLVAPDLPTEVGVE